MKLNYFFKDLKFNDNLWNSKEELFKSFFGDFYDFILNNNGAADLESHNINSKDDFYKYADYYADGQENCYAMGFSFYKYYLTPDENGTIETQPTDTFIGYCYHNKKYLDFLNFLISFFAYWRNDEGCTKFVPYNHADKFFNSSWAALVDTSKLFYFTSETVYGWQSFRVKYTLDHIPGVILEGFNGTLLPKLRVAGYEFLGWFDKEEEGASLVSNPVENQNVYAHFIRKDIYNYWEKEEKKIYKEYVADYKKADPL